MEYQAPKSKCQLCGSMFAKKGLTKHIKSCLVKHLQRISKIQSKELFYVVITDTYNSDYFLHVLIQNNITLEDLDNFLRNIWLECCGHMSAFSYQRYGDEIDMRKKTRDIFTPGSELNYQYDFGSTTELSIRAIDIINGTIEGNRKIQILSRNAQPIISCEKCGNKPTVLICTDCQWNENGWLCEECAKCHECGEDMFLPVVNSPRTGVCAYTGN